MSGSVPASKHANAAVVEPVTVKMNAERKKDDIKCHSGIMVKTPIECTCTKIAIDG